MTDAEKDAAVLALAKKSAVRYIDAAEAIGCSEDDAIPVVNRLVAGGKLVASQRHGRWVAEPEAPVMGPKETSNCPVCGKFFPKLIHGGKIYCGDKCRDVAGAKKLESKARPTPCAFCGAIFLSRPQGRGLWSKYCSRSCGVRKKS
jgi:hypothetical protein